jgi:hypothetical protein
VLPTLEDYEDFIFTLPQRFPLIRYSTLVFLRLEPFTAMVRGEIFFEKGICLRILEILDFDDEERFIQRYSYEVYRDDEKLYWYDPFPHPHIPELSVTDPHHKHVPPDIKHHRIPAPRLSFVEPNLPFLIQEIETMLLQ